MSRLKAALIALTRRAVPRIVAWTSCFLVLTAVGVVLLLLAAFQTR
ncbi:MAG: hypothetical protein ACRDPX_11660 [Gaiellaceae bacterium]